MPPVFVSPFNIEHPSSIVPTLLGLAVLVFLIVKFALPGARATLNDRSTRIETDQVQVERQLQDVEQLRNDYATRIQMIEKEQRERIAAAVRDADNARADIIAEAEETARALRRRSEEEIGRERTRQRILMRQQLVQITIDAAEQAVRAQNTDTVQRHLIREFIGKVGGHEGNGANGNSQPLASVTPPLATTVPITTAPLPASTPGESLPVAETTQAAQPAVFAGVTPPTVPSTVPSIESTDSSDRAADNVTDMFTVSNDPIDPPTSTNSQGGA